MCYLDNWTWTPLKQKEYICCHDNKHSLEGTILPPLLVKSNWVEKLKCKHLHGQVYTTQEIPIWPWWWTFPDTHARMSKLYETRGLHCLCYQDDKYHQAKCFNIHDAGLVRKGEKISLKVAGKNCSRLPPMMLWICCEGGVGERKMQGKSGVICITICSMFRQAWAMYIAAKLPCPSYSDVVFSGICTSAAVVQDICRSSLHANFLHFT